MLVSPKDKREKELIEAVEASRKAILETVTKGKDSDAEIYEATEAIFDKYSIHWSKKEFILVCRHHLGNYIREFRLGHDFAKLFKNVHKYSREFAIGASVIDQEKKEFITEIINCLPDQSIEYSK